MRAINLALIALTTVVRATFKDYDFGDEYIVPVETNEYLDESRMMGKFNDIFKFETPQILKDIALLNVRVPPVAKHTPYRFSKPSAIQDLKLHFINSLISYCVQDEVFFKDCICRETYSNIHVIEQKGIDSVVVVAVNTKTKVIVVSYRPTVTIRNWKSDYDYPLVDMEGAPAGVKVHRGFYNYYLSTIERSYAAMETIVNNPAYKNYPLIITGYSLGAAIATISLPGWSWFLSQHNDDRKIEVFAYSGPRVGNQNFAYYLSTFNSPVIRYTNQNDIVNHLPPRSFGYVHAGVEIYARRMNFSLISELVQCSEFWDEDPNCSYSTETPFSSLRHVYPFDNFVPLPPYCQA